MRARGGKAPERRETKASRRAKLEQLEARAMSAAKTVPPTAPSSCDRWEDVEWRSSAVAPVLLIVPTIKLRHALAEALDEWIGTGNLDRGLLLAEQELPSVIVLEVDANWTDRQLDTMIRLQRINPHASFVAVPPRGTKEGIRIACDCLNVDAYLYNREDKDNIPLIVETVLEYRADYLRELVERAAQAGKVRP